MGTDERAILPLPKCKAQKLKISLRVHAHHSALFHVHLELEFSLKVSSTGFKQTFSCPRCVGKHNDVICIPNHMDASALHLTVKLVEVDVGKQGTERPSLRRAFFRLDAKSVFHHAAFEKSLDEFNHALVVDFLSYHVHQQIMIQCVEILGQINEYRCGIALLRVFFHFLNRHLCASVRSVAVAPIREQRFVDWGQLLGDCLLDDAVYDCRDSQLSYAAIRLWDFLPLYRLRLVFAVSDLVKKFFPVFPQPRQGILHSHSVDAGCSLVGLYPLVRPVQVVPVQYAFQQVCTVHFFGFPSVSTPRSRILFMFRTIPLRAASVSGVFCFLHTDLLSPFLRTYDCSALPSFFLRYYGLC